MLWHVGEFTSRATLVGVARYDPIGIQPSILDQPVLSVAMHLNYKFSWSIAMSKRTWGQPTIVLLILEFTLSNNHRARPTFNVVPMPLIPMKIPCWVFLVPICTWTSSVLRLLLHVHNDFLLQTLYYNEYYDLIILSWNCHHEYNYCNPYLYSSIPIMSSP